MIIGQAERHEMVNMSKPKVVVVLSTYNGSRFIKEQLDSLLSQSRLPDRIEICDDCSTDNTQEIVRDYIAEHRKASVSFEFTINNKNAGWKSNFKKLISSCDADYIFPCDQDDIWQPNKIARMIDIMESNPDFDLLACSVEPFYEEGSKKTNAGSTEVAEGTESLESEKLSPDFMYIRHPGCSYCVRGSFAKRVLPFWESSYPHDATLWRYAVLEGGAAVVNERLVRFRRHGGNASDRKRQTRADRIADVDYYIDFIENACRFAENEDRCGNDACSILASCADWLDARRKLLSTGSPIAALDCLRCRCFYNSGRSLILDLLFAWVNGIRI